MKNDKKPKIRFKGFDDDWEQRKLGEICSRVQGNDGRMELPTLTISTANGWMKQEDRFSGNIAGKEQKNYTLLHKGELSYNHGNSKLAKYGTVFSLQTYEEALVPRVYHSFKVEIGSADFIEYYFATKMPDRELRRLVSSGARMDGLLNIGCDDFMGIKMMFPSVLEQDKIAEYFRAFDHLITLNQRKYEKLQKIKKSMLEKMFPKNEAKKPEIRFKGFNDDWEQRKLLDCIQKITDFRGRTPKKLGMDWSKEGYLALSALNVKDGYIDFNQDVHYGSQELYDKWMTGNELHKGQVLFTTEAPMGNVAQVPDNRRYILSQRTIAFDVKDELITEDFLATVLRTPSVFADLTALSSGGTAKGVSQKSLSSVEIRLPKDLKEQERIADNFSNIDKLITLHQRELEKMKYIKKSMLEKMFNILKLDNI